MIPIFTFVDSLHQPQTFRSGGNVAKFDTLAERSFSVNEANSEIYVVWGLQELDRSHCHRTNFGCLGKPIYDSAFDLSEPQVQGQLAVRNYLEFLSKLTDDHNP